MRGWTTGCGVLLLAAAGMAQAQSNGVTGNWRTPTGSVVSAYPCGDAVCLKIMQLERGTPGFRDEKNPDSALRSRALCGLQIGSGFKLDEKASNADGGSIYDPKNGKTYSATMAEKGDVLKLRGYVGVKMFGRSEEWTRVNEPVSVCQQR